MIDAVNTGRFIAVVLCFVALVFAEPLIDVFLSNSYILAGDAGYLCACRRRLFLLKHW